MHETKFCNLLKSSLQLKNYITGKALHVSCIFCNLRNCRSSDKENVLEYERLLHVTQ